MSGFSPSWLALREPADAEARAPDLLERVRADLGGVRSASRNGTVAERIVISDLGCGTGSMGRWLSARLPGPQHWILYDHDADLLAHAAATVAGVAGDGSAVTVETRRHDITRLAVGNLTGSTLITASALLDLLTLEEVRDLAAACAGAGCPALLTLSVVGRVELSPAEPFDAEVAAAFNAHQRRSTGGRLLLGPDAVDAAAEAFAWLGATVRVSPSPWRLGPDAADRSGPSPGSGAARADASVSARAGGDERAPGNGAGAARADASRAGGDRRTPGNGAGSGPADGYDPVDPSRRQGAAGAGGRQNEPDTSGRQSGSSRADADKYAIRGTNGRQYDSDRAELIAAWLDGWVGAACEQRPELAEEGAPYLRRRLAATAAGELCVTVHHSDLYAKFE